MIGGGRQVGLRDAGLRLDDRAVADAGTALDALPQDAPMLPSNGSEHSGDSIPRSVEVGSSFDVSVTMRNTGTTTWSQAEGYALGSESPRDDATWGVNRIGILPGVAVAPGESHTFTQSVRAPGEAGAYTMQWAMVQGESWFGAITPLVTIDVTAPRPDPGSRPREIVQLHRSMYGTPMTDGELIECLRAIARQLNAERIPAGPYGVLVKRSGRNCEGYSCDIICAGQDEEQRQWDVFVDAEGEARATWSEVGTLAIRPCEILP